MKLMKSCVFHKKYLLAGIYIIFVLFTCCNSQFYHTPLAKICSVTEKQTLSREGTRGSKEYYYTQNITARILNGSHKGEKITSLMNIHLLRFRPKNIIKETPFF